MKITHKLILACAAWGLSFSPMPNVAPLNDCAAVRQTLREYGQLTAMQAGAAVGNLGDTFGQIADLIEAKL